MGRNGRCEVVIGLSCQRDWFRWWQDLQPELSVRKDLDIDAHRIHVLQTLCPQILELGSKCGRIDRLCQEFPSAITLMSRQEPAHGLLDRRVLKVFFKCNDFHIFPFLFFLWRLRSWCSQAVETRLLTLPSPSISH